MYNLIRNYMNKVNKDDINNFAIKNDILLSDDELDFTYMFIKKNWDKILSNPNLLDLNKYKDKYTLDNFNKIKILIKKYYVKYHKYL